MQIHVFFGVQKAKVSSRCLHYFPAATNMSFPYWALQISAKHFDEYLKFSKKHWPKNWALDFVRPITSVCL